MSPLRKSCSAASIAITAEFDFGDRQNSITAFASGMRASGKPTLSADSIAARCTPQLVGWLIRYPHMR